jgi:hypothetical protein
MIGGIAGFAARYPLVWHVIEAEGADCDTLYPAATLRRLSGLPADDTNREAFQHVDLPGGASAILRLQLMPDYRLAPTLAGPFSGRPDLWRAHIDRHVFFWVAEDRRDRFLRACVRLRARDATGPVPTPVVIAIDTALLLAMHAEVASFSRINVGSTVRGGARARRDETTLRPVPRWRGEPAVELAIRGQVALTPELVCRGHAPARNAARCAATTGQERSEIVRQMVGKTQVGD